MRPYGREWTLPRGTPPAGSNSSAQGRLRWWCLISENVSRIAPQTIRLRQRAPFHDWRIISAL